METGVEGGGGMGLRQGVERGDGDRGVGRGWRQGCRERMETGV